ncbi:hypothetical protein [Pseudaquabacterium terrae]|uniref:hypothetical protein n=1 Tax=Pseudaquabacterium terrae TaxID=2732868 RepID=UPI001FEAFD17|nr:hypothetical protein [Aquabacterium terrae]
MIEQWERQARPFFERHGSYPAAFERLLNAVDASSLHPAHLLTHARIAWQLGHEEQARRFGAAGLARVPPSASILARELSDLRAEMSHDR